MSVRGFTFDNGATSERYDYNYLDNRPTIDTTLTVSGAIPDSKAVGDELDAKVDKVAGKDLSTNDYTTAEKTKLAGLPSTISISDGVLIIS